MGPVVIGQLSGVGISVHSHIGKRGAKGRLHASFHTAVKRMPAAQPALNRSRRFAAAGAVAARKKIDPRWRTRRLSGTGRSNRRLETGGIRRHTGHFAGLHPMLHRATHTRFDHGDIILGNAGLGSVGEVFVQRTFNMAAILKAIIIKIKLQVGAVIGAAADERQDLSGGMTDDCTQAG
jgi:hypothetical protein